MKFTIFHNSYGTGEIVVNDPEHPLYGHSFNSSVEQADEDNAVSTTLFYLDYLVNMTSIISPNTGEPMFVVNPTARVKGWGLTRPTTPQDDASLRKLQAAEVELPPMSLGTPLNPIEVKTLKSAFQMQLDGNPKTKGQSVMYVTDMQLGQTHEGKRFITFINSEREVKAYDNTGGDTADENAWKNPFHPKKKWGVQLARDLWRAATPEGTALVTSMFIAIKQNGEFTNFQRVIQIVGQDEPEGE